MASDYGLNFGFRRSDESVRLSEGREKVPASGTFLLGSLVSMDPANLGFLKAAASAEVGEGGTVGLLVQEEIWDRSIYAPDRIDSFYYGVARNNRLAVISSGAGTKVWFKNTPAQTRADGRTIAAVTMVDFTTPPAQKDYLTWNGTNFLKSTNGESDSMLRVTLSNGVDYVEAVLTR
jgi:hypothetical protein